MNTSYYNPLLIVDYNNTVEALNEEIFGPIISMICYNDINEGIQIYNKTNYGL